ncbi:Polysaccharide deacetylase [Belliella baltica DSM 15883]|uniref:Polysaccharide deacetylase n=2 Tax=Belliella TaxID=232244 RepID=I3Z8W6_BELBD|nr:Polysaccharide deacetylase [Belliella baltica DSM 15883]
MYFMNQLDTGAWIISLDFELLWGIFDKPDNKVNTPYFSNTRELVPRMLDSFARHYIEATWATVGMLFAENKEEWESFLPKIKPSYRNKEYSAYEWVKKHGLQNEYHFAPDLIKKIIDTPGQELGSHSFAHYYTLMRGQTPSQFRNDLQAAQRIAKHKFQINLSSLVFPRNHINLQYLKICKEEGFSQVRSNPKDWFWQETQHERVIKRIYRTADCFVSLGGCSSFGEDEIYQETENYPLEIPASRLLRPYYQKSNLINKWRLQRVMNEMTSAAKQKKIYHLWWHPHNFANNPKASLNELEILINHYKNLKETYGMKSFSMQSLANALNAPTFKSM